MSSAITALGQTRINQLRGEEKPLVIDRMVLALVPGLDPSQPVDRNQQMPDPAHIVHTHTIDDAHKGYVNSDQVVYSMILGSDVGDFSFNWIGTVEAVTGNVITVTITPETPKRKTDLGSNTTGNNITRNVMMRFQDAQALTGVSVSAETWQFDYTTWMTARIGEHDGDDGAHRDIRAKISEHAQSGEAHQDIRELLVGHGHNASDLSGVVGVLSEAGGAIIERGRNVNGEYVRWADGTQICWLRVSPSNTPWQYLTKTVPAEFVQPPLTPASVILTFTGGAGGVISGQEMSVNGAYLGAPSVMMYRINSGNPDYELNAVVIGRWFE